MSYRLEQGIIQRYRDARTCDVLQMPDHYLYSEVRLPETLQNQTKPLVGSTVMLATEDGFKSYVVSILREPLSLISREDTLRGNTILNKLQLQPGEIFLESRGPADSPIPGAGATFFLGNDGTASIYSGKRKEYLVIGGTADDNDGEVFLVGDNGFYESNINHLTNIQSVYRFDEDNNMKLGNILVAVPSVPTAVPPVEISGAELTIDKFGNIVLRNTIGAGSLVPTGVDNAFLKLNTTGQISLANAIAAFNASSTGAITIDGTTINFNNGTFGVARLNDATLVNNLTDPTFMAYLSLLDTFLSTLFLTFNLHTHISASPGNPTAPPLPLLITTPPTNPGSVIGKINAASSTVKAGG